MWQVALTLLYTTAVGRFLRYLDRLPATCCKVRKYSLFLQQIYVRPCFPASYRDSAGFLLPDRNSGGTLMNFWQRMPLKRNLGFKHD